MSKTIYRVEIWLSGFLKKNKNIIFNQIAPNLTYHTNYFFYNIWKQINPLCLIMCVAFVSETYLVPNKSFNFCQLWAMIQKAVYIYIFFIEAYRGVEICKFTKSPNTCTCRYRNLTIQLICRCRTPKTMFLLHASVLSSSSNLFPCISMENGTLLWQTPKSLHWYKKQASKQTNKQNKTTTSGVPLHNRASHLPPRCAE